MPENWRTQLGRIDTMSPPDDLLEREARGRTTSDRGRRPRLGAALVAGLLTLGLAIGGYVVLRDRPTEAGRNDVVAPPIEPRNGDFLYGKDTERGWGIFSLDPTTGEERQLTDGRRDYASDWSPDGTMIVYDSEVGGESSIVVANADGSDPVAIAEGWTPAWSPDGTSIAYAADDGSIWVVGVDGSNAHAVTDGSALGNDVTDYEPAWSPDGGSIAYNRYGVGETDELRVWSESADDVLVTDAYTYLGEIDWSPDGTTLVFSGALDPEGARQVLTIPAAGGEATAISRDNESWVSGATWSPDGSRIAYQAEYGDLVTVAPDGSERQVLELGYEIVNLSWGVAPPDA